MTWLLNGSDPGTVTVEFTIEPGGPVQSDAGFVWHTNPPGGTQASRVTGHEARRFTFTARVTGASPDRYEVLESVRETIRSGNPFSLVADAASQFRFFDGARGVVLRYSRVGEAWESGVSSTSLFFECFIEGKADDFGAFEDCIEGAAVFLENDFFTGTDDADYDDGVLLGVPYQKAGFPKARDPSTLGFTQPDLLSATIGLNSDGTESVIEVYDLGGYVAGKPHTPGEGGPFEACVCTDREAIDGFTDLVEVCISTLANDFSISDSTPALLGFTGGTTPTIVTGPAGATITLVSTETVLDSEGTSSTVDTYELDGDDGCYILDLA